MSNHRTTCYYCKEDVLSRDIGRHILRKHEPQLFGDKDNLKDLHRQSSLSEPIKLALGTDYYFFCLADNSCIRRAITATEHFKGKKELHRDAVMKLRDKYPVEGGTESAPETQREPLLSAKELKSIQEEIVLLFQHQVDNKIDVYEFSKKSKASLKKLGINVDFEDIKAEYPHCFPQPEVEEEQEEQPEEVYQEPPPPPEETEESDEHLPPPPPPYVPPPVPSSHYAIPKPRQETFLVKERTPAPAFPSVKIIQSTKRPSPSGAL